MPSTDQNTTDELTTNSRPTFAEFLANNTYGSSLQSPPSPQSVFELLDDDNDEDGDDDSYCDCGCMDNHDDFEDGFNPWENENSHRGNPEDYMPNTVSQTYRMPADTSSLVPHPFVVGTDRVGVEIELENIRHDMPRSMYWKDIEDGSLRNNGHEYVFRQPFGGRDLAVALQEIDSYLFDKNSDSSWRCSTHVHLDVRDMTASELKLLLLSYTVCERTLFRCSGWQRFKNNFCPSFSFAQGQMLILSRNWHLDGSAFIRQVASEWVKYSCLNLLPMRTQGSVEFRMSEAKRHKGQLLRLCNRLLSLKALAKSWQGTEEELVIHLMQTSPSEIFGGKGLPKAYVGDPDDHLLGAKLAVDIMHHNKIKNKDLVTKGNKTVSIPRVRQWGEISQFARQHNFTLEGIDFSEDATQPTELTYHQLRMLSRNVLMRLTWFLRNDEDVLEFEAYKRVCEENNL